MDVTPELDQSSVLKSNDQSAIPFQAHTKHPTNHLHFKFPSFKHEPVPIINVNDTVDGKLTAGDKIADAVTATIGSWRFIIIQSLLLITWMVLNSIAWIYRWDPYPFILLNLALSFQAAYSAPFVMMSQNRQSAKDRLTAENDYQTDLRGEQQLLHVLDHLDHQDAIILEIVQRLEAQNKTIHEQEQLILQLVQRIDGQQHNFKEQHQEILENIQTLKK